MEHAGTPLTFWSMRTWSADGLRLVPEDVGAALRAAAASVLGVLLFILLLDGWLFRAELQSSYVDFYRSALFPRMDQAMLGSLREEVGYRLLLMTGLVLILNRATRLRPAMVIGLAIGLAQLANVLPFVPLAPSYVLLRFWLVGCVWGWLYWRHGWVTAAIAHPLTHLLLDPLLLALLSRS